MKLMRCLFFLCIGATMIAFGQTNIPQIQHIIVVIQENRTPTNLFHEDVALIGSGAHRISPRRTPTTMPSTNRIEPQSMGVRGQDRNH